MSLVDWCLFVQLLCCVAKEVIISGFWWKNMELHANLYFCAVDLLNVIL